MNSAYLKKSYMNKMFFDIQIKKDQNHEISGKITSPIFENEFEFHHLDQMILTMDKVMDLCNRPVHDDRFRAFAKNDLQLEMLKLRNEYIDYNQCLNKQKVSIHDYRFFVTVSYRQHNSWQGSVASIKNRDSRNFRSALEFLCLINSAMF